MNKLFFDDPEREFHVRELSRILKKSPTTISKKLKELHEKRLLIQKKERGHLIFRANAENVLFKQKKKEYNKEKLFKSKLVDFLNKEYNYPECIALFGSYEKGEDIPRSDIDIAIITQSKKELNVSSFEKKLKRKIQLFEFSIENIEYMKKNNKELLNNILNGTMLVGFWELFR